MLVAGPMVVQPLNVPVSKPPLMMATPPPPTNTARLTVVLCDPEAAEPVTDSK